MTIDLLLYQLRARLKLIGTRIANHERSQSTQATILFAGGALLELRSEQAFLRDMIAQLAQAEAHVTEGMDQS